jgi:hypothetical protein
MLMWWLCYRNEGKLVGVAIVEAPSLYHRDLQEPCSFSGVGTRGTVTPVFTVFTPDAYAAPLSRAAFRRGWRSFSLDRGGSHRWHSHRSIRRVSIITWQPLTTMPLRIIIIRPSIITPSASMTKPSSTQLRLTNIANSLTNIPRLPALILINDDATCAIGAPAARPGRELSPARTGQAFFQGCKNATCHLKNSRMWGDFGSTTHVVTHRCARATANATSIW